TPTTSRGLYRRLRSHDGRRSLDRIQSVYLVGPREPALSARGRGGGIQRRFGRVARIMRDFRVNVILERETAICIWPFGRMMLIREGFIKDHHPCERADRTSMLDEHSATAPPKVRIAGVYATRWRDVRQPAADGEPAMRLAMSETATANTGARHARGN